MPVTCRQSLPPLNREPVMFQRLLRGTQICEIFELTPKAVMNGQTWNRRLARCVLHYKFMLRKLEFLYISHERSSVRASYSTYLFQMSCDCFGLNCIFARGAYQYFVRGKVLKELLWQRSRTRWRRYCRHGDGGQYLEDVQLGSVG